MTFMVTRSKDKERGMSGISRVDLKEPLVTLRTVRGRGGERGGGEGVAVHANVGGQEGHVHAWEV